MYDAAVVLVWVLWVLNQLSPKKKKNPYLLASASVGLFLFHPLQGNQVGASQLLCLLHERILQTDAVAQILPAKGENQEAHRNKFCYFVLNFNIHSAQ